MLVVELAPVNPKLECNYRDESEIGDAAAVRGTANQTAISKALLARYRATFLLSST